MRTLYFHLLKFSKRFWMGVLETFFTTVTYDCISAIESNKNFIYDFLEPLKKKSNYYDLDFIIIVEHRDESGIWGNVRGSDAYVNKPLDKYIHENIPEYKNMALCVTVNLPRKYSI